MTDTPSIRSAAEALLLECEVIRDQWERRPMRPHPATVAALRAALDSPPGPLAAELERLAEECEREIPMHLSHYSVTESNGRVRAYRHAAQLAREHEGGGLRWSAEKPSVPGLYLLRVHFIDGNGEMASTIELVTREESGEIPLNAERWEWAGPIPPPSEETP